MIHLFRRAPQNVDDNIKLARSNWRAGDYARAVAILDDAVTNLGPTVPLFIARADLEESRRNLPAVIENLNSAIAHAKRAEQAPIQKRLAYVMRRHGQREMSRQVLVDAGLIDRPTFVRTFPDGLGILGMEVYPIRANGEAITFLDHNSDLDILLVKSKRAILWTHNAGLDWQTFLDTDPQGITTGFVVNDKHVLLYDSKAGVLRLHDHEGKVLAVHPAPIPWHGSWGPPASE